MYLKQFFWAVIPDFCIFVIFYTYVDSKSLLLTFRSEYQEGKAIATTRKLHVGCVLGSKPATKKVSKQFIVISLWSVSDVLRNPLLCSQTVEFVWESVSPVEQQGFRVAPTQGSVDAGHRRPITITWMPSSGLAVSIETFFYLLNNGDLHS